MEGEPLMETIEEMFPTCNRFSDESKELTGVWIELRNFMDWNGVSMTQNSSRRVILQLEHFLYDDAEDRWAAVEIANEIVAEGRRPITMYNGES